VAKQKSNLFEFAAAIMAESGTGATKVVGRQMIDLPLFALCDSGDPWKEIP
jgi:hypothetical protein